MMVRHASACSIGWGVLALGGCGGSSNRPPALVTTTTSLTASPASIVLGATVTLTAAVEYAPAETASGTVNFLDGEAILGSASLDAEGVTSFKLTTLAVGTHSLTAAYTGNNTTMSSTSAAVTVTVTAKTASEIDARAPIRIALSSVPETAMYEKPQKFALAVSAKALDCNQQATGPAPIELQRADARTWHVYCTGDVSRGAMNRRGYTVFLQNGENVIGPGGKVVTDESGQDYLLFLALPAESSRDGATRASTEGQW
jgi:hypothetical protein